MATKNYAILYNDTEVIFPVKAYLNPYNNKRAYCAGQPQFFGGKDEDDEGPLKSLQREVSEESLQFFEIAELGPKIYTGTYQANNFEDVTCNFYCTAEWKATDDLSNWPSLKNWQKYSDKYREMCWVGTVPKKSFSSVSSASDVAAVLISSAPNNAPAWAQNQMAKNASPDFLDSLTLQAFTAFVTAWNESKL